mgnify:CR=1 FL=1
MVFLILCTLGTLNILKELPRTRSGKILRRLLRDILENKNYKIKDLSTLLNKNIIKEIDKEINKVL